ncbi:ABC transporter substrate-binding protein [Mucilaginibacter sp. AW1-3]
MKIKHLLLCAATAFVLASCHSSQKANVPVIGFVDAFEDATIAQARTGFTDALKQNGFSEDQHNVKIEYHNAQGSIPTLTLIVNQFIGEKVDLLATCTTLSTITALQKTKDTDLPVFAMVSPTPLLMKVNDEAGDAPHNLYGTCEDLDYIDTSFSIIPQLVKPKHGKLTVGMIYNQSEPQSVDAMDRIKDLSEKLKVTLVALPVNTSADAQLVTQALLGKNIDVFFANPDNTVFASFETIVKSCNNKNVPIFTSEAGLVQRGAVAAFGADIYQWGYQTGVQAAKYLKTHKSEYFKWEMVKVRKRVYNPAAAKKYGITIPANFEAVK